MSLFFYILIWNFNFHNGPIIKYLTKFSKALYDERVQNNFNFLLCNYRETIYLITDFGE